MRKQSFRKKWIARPEPHPKPHPLKFRSPALVTGAALSCILSAGHAWADAPEYFDCLIKSRGKTVTWSSNWQGDQQDDGVAYRVASVGDNQSKYSRTITLELAALTRAKKNLRYFPVSEAQTAKDLCLKLSGGAFVGNREPALLPPKSSPKPPLGYRPSPTPLEAERPPDFPFIHYTDDHGWILGDPPPYQILTTCELLGKKFRCLQKEKTAHENELNPIAEELEVRPK